MTLREAAQALLATSEAFEEHAINGGPCHAACEPRASLTVAQETVRAALALPEAGWEAAYRTVLLEIAEGIYEDAITLRAWARDALAALPLPPSPAAPEADPWPTHRAVVGSGTIGPGGRIHSDEEAKPCPCGAPAYKWHRSTPLCTHMQATNAPAPEATAESEVGWLVLSVWEGEPRVLIDGAGSLIPESEGGRVKAACEQSNAGPLHNPRHKHVPVRVRVTVEPEPSPVEPEGAKGAKP